MKNLLVFLFLFTVVGSFAQHSPFVRLYNSEGHKFKKGRLERTTDSGLVFKAKGMSSGEISYRDIYKIRLRKSAGLTALIVGGIPILWGTSLIIRDKYWDGLVGALLVIEGVGMAPVAGGIKALLNPKPIMIKGDPEQWKKAKLMLDKKIK